MVESPASPLAPVLAAVAQKAGTGRGGSIELNRASDSAPRDDFSAGVDGSDAAVAAEAAVANTEEESATDADGGGDVEVREGQAEPANHNTDRNTGSGDDVVDHDDGAGETVTGDTADEGPAEDTVERAAEVETAETAATVATAATAETAAMVGTIRPDFSPSRPHTPSLEAAREDWADEARASALEKSQTINYGHYKNAFPVSSRGYVRWKDIDGGYGVVQHRFCLSLIPHFS